MSNPWIQRCVQRLVAKGVCPQEHAVVFVVNRTEVTKVVGDLIRAFPPTALHAFAAKANPLQGVLEVVQKAGMGCETASIGEFEMATRVFPDENIVFDSPMKTIDELKNCLYRRCFVNLDNFQELDRVVALNAEKPIVATVGFRINPQLSKPGSISELSTGTPVSKFGIPIAERARVLAAFQAYPFLKMLHIHTGSQGVSLDLAMEGLQKLEALATEIGDQVKFIDIGGGLSVNFAGDEYTPTFADYAARMRNAVPTFFEDKRYTLITEFGRAVVAKAGIFASRVEYTKESGGRYLVHQHVGSDLCVRTVWAPKDWPLRVAVFDGSNGAERTTDLVESDIAGPCCLGGDVTAKCRLVPKAFQNDVVVHKDVGGYYHSSFSMYNLRQAPAVYLFDDAPSAEHCGFTLIKKAATVADTLRFMEKDC